MPEPSLSSVRASHTATLAPNRIPQLFSQNVRQLRLDAGMTQEALAERCSRYKKQISKIEDGTAKVNLSMIYALAQALNVDPSTLLKEKPGSSQQGH